MADIDWCSIFNNSGTYWSHDYTDVMTAKVPAACNTCKGTGIESGIDMHGDSDFWDCPDCPTIAKLLAIGTAVMTAQDDGYGVRVDVGGETYGTTDGARFLLRILRVVEP